MKYEKNDKFIEIFGKDDFNPQHILECGQIFSYAQTENGYVVYSNDKKAEIEEIKSGYLIKTEDVDYFENFFDLKTDYSKIKHDLSAYKIMEKPIKFGYGIRILKQDLFETLISFIVSANNNIKRIQLILNRMREKLGKKMENYYAFPSRQSLQQVDEQFFKDIGAGYRASYLFKVVNQVDEKTLNEWRKLSTDDLRKELIGLSGVGPKVADCILLFGYGRGDVFPVDTWIKQMYEKIYKKEGNREKIRKDLTEEFGMMSGYAQQYLFYFMRAKEE